MHSHLPGCSAAAFAAAASASARALSRAAISPRLAFWAARSSCILLNLSAPQRTFRSPLNFKPAFRITPLLVAKMFLAIDEPRSGLHNDDRDRSILGPFYTVFTLCRTSCRENVCQYV